MRFSVATVAILASAVMAEKTYYATELITITSCAPTVTNCPARSTVTSTTSYPVSDLPVTTAPVASYPVSGVPIPSSVINPSYPAGNTTVGVPSYTAKVPSSEVATENSPVGTAPVASYSVITISTCIPTVIYQTVPVAAPTTTAKPSAVPIPSGGGSNGTTVATASKPAFTGAAVANSGSYAIAAVGGFAALLLV